MRMTIVIVALALVPVSLVHAQIPAAERNALVALYNSTNGDAWTNIPPTEKWKDSGGAVFRAPGTECAWYGVYCNPSLSQVTSLTLVNNNLDGPLPVELGNLSLVRDLYLSDNHLTGSIPPELADASLLRQLWLNDNQLTGSIPPELGTLSTMWKLILANNQLTGSIPPELGDLPSLLYLHLGENQLTGSIPPELGQLTSLSTGLQLEGNQLTGSIPPELGDLVNLTNLRLNDNQLGGSIPPELGDLVDLTHLHLHNNQLTGAIPPDLADLPVVEQLFLYSNQLEGSIPPQFGTMTAPVDLILSDNQLSGAIPPELGNMTAVRALNLASNQLTGEIPIELMDLSTILILDLSYNLLHTENPVLAAFLDAKLGDVLWRMTQTVPPENPMVGPGPPVGDHTIWLTWVPIDYQMDPGGYEVFSSPTATPGVWISGGWNNDKATPVFPVTGLNPGTSYDLAVASFTDPHTFNQSLLISDLSAVVTQTTANTGCPQPVIDVAGTGMGPFTLSLTESYDSYAWSTGDTDPTLEVNAPYPRWYWVAVTSAGPCAEAAAILIDPEILIDGFETGNTDEWSAVVP